VRERSSDTIVLLHRLMLHQLADALSEAVRIVVAF
jgi:hypothetical protein